MALIDKESSSHERKRAFFFFLIFVCFVRNEPLCIFFSFWRRHSIFFILCSLLGGRAICEMDTDAAAEVRSLLLNDHLEHPAAVVCHAAVCCRAGDERHTAAELKRVIALASDFSLFNIPHSGSSVRVSSDAEIDQWGPMAVLLPDRAAIQRSGVPLIRSRRLHSIVCSKHWSVVISICTLLGIILTQVRNIPNQSPTFNDLSAGAGLLLLGVSLSMHASMYDRGLFQQLLRNFQFWYLALQVLLGVLCMSYEAIKLSNTWLSLYVLTAVRIFGDAAIVVALFGLDASSISRPAKGIVSLLVAITFALWGYLWKVKVSEPLDVVIDLWVWSATPRSILQSVFLTEAAFFANYAFSSLYRKHHTMMLRILPQRLPLDRIAGSLYQGNCTASFSITRGGSSARASEMAEKNVKSPLSPSSSEGSSFSLGSFRHDVVWSIERKLDLEHGTVIIGADAESGGIRRVRSESLDSFIEVQSSLVAPARRCSDVVTSETSSLSPATAARVRAESFLDLQVRPSAVMFTAAVMTHCGEETDCLRKVLGAIFSCSSLSFVSTDVVTSLSGYRKSEVTSNLVEDAETPMIEMSCNAAIADAEDGRRRKAFFSARRTGESQRWLHHKVLIPKTPAFVDDCTPMLQIPLLHMLTVRAGYVWHCFLLSAVSMGLALMIAGFTMMRDHLQSMVTAGAFIYSLALLGHVSMLNKGVVLRLAREFEVWFLAAQNVVLGGCCVYEASLVSPDDASVGPWFLTAMIALSFALQAVSMVGMDACFAPRLAKGLFSGLLSVLFFVWACASSRFSRDSPLDDPIRGKVDILFFNLSIRLVAQNAMVTLAVFSAKYSITALLLQNDALILRFAIERLVSDRVVFSKAHNCWVGTNELKYNAANGFECAAKYVDAIAAETAVFETESAAKLETSHDMEK